MSDEVKITLKKKQYNPTDSGKGWQSKPFEEFEVEITEDEYFRYVDSIPFFNNWGDGASCKGYKSYTSEGYIVTSIVTIAPYRWMKTVVEFTFEY